MVMMMMMMMATVMTVAMLPFLYSRESKRRGMNKERLDRAQPDTQTGVVHAEV